MYSRHFNNTADNRSQIRMQNRWRRRAVVWKFGIAFLCWCAVKKLHTHSCWARVTPFFTKKMTCFSIDARPLKFVLTHNHTSLCIIQCPSSQSFIFFWLYSQINKTVKCATLVPPLGARVAGTATLAPSGGTWVAYQWYLTYTVA